MIEGGVAGEGMKCSGPERPVSGDATLEPVKLDIGRKLLRQGGKVIAGHGLKVKKTYCKLPQLHVLDRSRRS